MTYRSHDVLSITTAVHYITLHATGGLTLHATGGFMRTAPEGINDILIGGL